MQEFSLEDTIIAISTPPGYGGIGVIRLSGMDALKIAKKMFRAKRSGAKFLPRQAVFGNLMDFQSQEAIDEGFCLYFPEPHSYTKENVVEISCHGGPAVMEEALRLGIRAGARHAHPGEFTWRAYARGRIDILQAEAINGLIRADSVVTAKLAFNQVNGSLSKKIARLRAQTLDLISRIEATIEFPDDAIPVSSGEIAIFLGKMVDFLADLISSYDTGKTLTDGVTLAITGRTNVGKSTLFNAILEDERAIVTPLGGTTRDYIREKIKIKNAFFNLVDMAGLGKPASAIEKEGIKRSKIIASQANGLLLLLDISRKEKAEDFALLEEFRDKKALLVFNKIDLPQKMNAAQIKKRFKNFPSLEISALRGTNLERLKRKIHDVFSPELGDREEIIFHVRQKLQLEEIRRHFKKGLELLESGYPEEFCAEEIRAAIPLIGRLTGEIRAEDVIQHIFSKFCLGK